MGIKPQLFLFLAMKTNTKTPNDIISHEELKHLLSYDPLTGEFTAKVSLGRKVKKGEKVGTTNTSGRRYTTLRYKQYQLARLACYYMTGSYPHDCWVDHINGDKSDDRWSNLRPVTPKQNGQNNNKHLNKPFAGVRQRKSDWLVNVRIDNDAYYLGGYPTLLDAMAAKISKINEVKGEFSPFRR
ncbi:Fis family transcriptional regulator [Caballeronia jiangsuensis]|nr:Fis family transcriptional regulator [Caballeronia jiangsuensis]